MLSGQLGRRVSCRHTDQCPRYVFGGKIQIIFFFSSIFAVPPVLAPFSFGTLSYSDSSLSSILTLGARARVLCGLTRGDTPVSFSWLKDGHSLQQHHYYNNQNRNQNRNYDRHSSKVTISIVDDFSSLLTISRLERGHAGNYTCLASNEAGSDLFTAILDVQGDFRKQYPKITCHWESLASFVFNSYTLIFLSKLFCFHFNTPTLV